MSYPNSALSGWQLALIAVVAVSSVAGWLVAVFLAARAPRADRAAGASAPPNTSVPGDGGDQAKLAA